MSSSVSLDPQKGWAHYVVPPVAASVAIVPAFSDLVAKSALQQGQVIPHMTSAACVKGGIKLSPTVGVLVGSQMLVQEAVEERLIGKFQKDSFASKLASAAVTGAVSSPVVAMFNGQAAGKTLRECCRGFTPKQAFAITAQETAFVAGLSIADTLGVSLKNSLGDYVVIDYFAAFIAGAAGSLVGHPANTALTRWQNGMVIEGVEQFMWGALRKARAIGVFALGYKLGKEMLSGK